MGKKKLPPWQSKKIRDVDSTIEYAGALKVPYLYRYLDFVLQEYHPGWQNGPEFLKDILVHNRVRCSNPANFNDPWDCKPCVHPDSFKDPNACSIMAESLIATQKGGPKGDPLDTALRNNPKVLKKLMEGFNGYYPTFISERWKLICLSEKACSTLMWSHYSRNHHGICLEFAVDQTIFASAMRVHYKPIYPRLILGTEEYKDQMLTVKAECWKYEHEFRLICPASKETTGSPESPLVLKDGFLDIGPTSLKSVIVGCQMPAETVDVVSGLLKECAPSVRLKRVIRAGHHYDLTIEPVH